MYPTNIEIIAKLHEQFCRKNTTTRLSQNPLARASQILFQQRDELGQKFPFNNDYIMRSEAELKRK